VSALSLFAPFPLKRPLPRGIPIFPLELFSCGLRPLRRSSVRRPFPNRVVFFHRAAVLIALLAVVSPLRLFPVFSKSLLSIFPPPPGNTRALEGVPPSSPPLLTMPLLLRERTERD